MAIKEDSQGGERRNAKHQPRALHTVDVHSDPGEPRGWARAPPARDHSFLGEGCHGAGGGVCVSGWPRHVAELGPPGHYAGVRLEARKGEMIGGVPRAGSTVSK